MEWNEKTFSRFVYISDPRISIDGKFVTYTVSKPNVEKDDYDKYVVIQSLEDGSRRFIEKASTARISPDGKWIAFTRQDKESKKTVLVLADFKSLSERELARFDGVSDLSWSPDSRKLAVVAFKKREDDHFVFSGDVPFWFDQMGFLGGRKDVVKVLDVESGEELLEREMEIFSKAIWHGSKLVLSISRREKGIWKEFDVIEIDPESSEEKKLFENVGFMAVDSSGGLLLLHGRERMETFADHRYLYVFDGKEVRALTERFGLTHRFGKIFENEVFFDSDDAGKMTLKVLDLESGEVRVINDDESWVVEFDVGGGRVVFLKQDSKSPGELYLWDGRGTRRITSYNDEIVRVLRPVEPVHFTFENLGHRIDGWYLKPDGEGKKPVVVFVHGGPKGMFGYNFRFDFQFMVKNGFYVLYINPRGSSGYSEDFAKEVLKRTGKEDFQDVLKGLETFLEMEKDADRERIGITGISYGGFMTNWAVTQTDLFKAAVSENGISDWLDMYKTSDISLWFVKELIGEDPFSDETYGELSPITHVKNVKTPILLIHSLQDYRCPLDQSLGFFNVLKDLGKEAYLMVFKSGAHGHSLFSKPKHRMKRYKAILEFFRQKLVEGKEEFELKLE